MTNANERANRVNEVVTIAGINIFYAQVNKIKYNCTLTDKQAHEITKRAAKQVFVDKY